MDVSPLYARATKTISIGLPLQCKRRVSFFSHLLRFLSRRANSVARTYDSTPYDLVGSHLSFEALRSKRTTPRAKSSWENKPHPSSSLRERHSSSLQATRMTQSTTVFVFTTADENPNVETVDERSKPVYSTLTHSLSPLSVCLLSLSSFFLYTK